MARRTYTAKQKSDALDLVRTEGQAEAARRTGIPLGSIKGWANRAGITMEDPAPDSVRMAVMVRRRSLAERKARLLELLGEIAELGAERELELLAMVESNDLRSVVGARTRAIHDMQLLAGDVTARTEMLVGDAKAQAEEALAVLDELAAKRAARSA